MNLKFKEEDDYTVVKNKRYMFILPNFDKNDEFNKALLCLNL